jgi:hypothetical protein
MRASVAVASRAQTAQKTKDKAERDARIGLAVLQGPINADHGPKIHAARSVRLRIEEDLYVARIVPAGAFEVPAILAIRNR